MPERSSASTAEETSPIQSQRSIGELDREGSQANSSDSKKLEEEVRKSLPIYPFRGELLEAIKDYQVLVLAADAGTGKTTQITQYLHESGYTTTNECGEKKRSAAASRLAAGRVSQEMGVNLGQEVGYSARLEEETSDRTVIKYMTDEILLREALDDPLLTSYSAIMVDEAHERTIWTDVLLGLMKCVIVSRPDLKLIVSCGGSDACRFSEFFNHAPIFYVPSRVMHPVAVYYLKSPEEDYVNAAVVTTLQIHVNEPRGCGDILVFLPWEDEIQRVEVELRNLDPELIICRVNPEFEIEGAREGARKVVLATNAAETWCPPINDSIRYVVDTGVCMMDSANQRTLRAGRAGPGKCYRMCTRFSFHNEMLVPEMQSTSSTNLAGMVLYLKSVRTHDMARFDFVDRPSSESLAEARELLFNLDAVDQHGELTSTGRRMAKQDFRLGA
ncbi:Probable pre-mRNA-splicing factor ATP-dependent RNA helicase DEAH6 [Linum grandiflorum]